MSEHSVTTRGVIVKYYRLARDPHGCHVTYVDHVVSHFITQLEYVASEMHSDGV